LISQGVPRLGESNNGEVANTTLHTHTAIARLPGVSYRLSCNVISTVQLQQSRSLAHTTSFIICARAYETMQVKLNTQTEFVDVKFTCRINQVHLRTRDLFAIVGILVTHTCCVHYTGES